MNPRMYDTEHFVFTYLAEHEKQTLTIKRKNADMKGYDCNAPYKTSYEGVTGFSQGMPACIEISPIFSHDTSAEMHIHKVGQFFTPWFKQEKDCRQEIEYAIKRFYALEAYNYLDLGPDQFAHALKNNRLTYEQILERVPTLYARRQYLIDTFKKTYQDKGVSTARGTTIFDTLDFVWVMSETTQQHPDKPEYLWHVNHFDRNFSPLGGHGQFVAFVGGENGSNQACFEYVMAEQKKRYGASPVDLDKVVGDITRLHNIIAQFELMLDIPFAKTAVPEED